MKECKAWPKIYKIKSKNKMKSLGFYFFFLFFLKKNI
jgi:hypothetical protein